MVGLMVGLGPDLIKLGQVGPARVRAAEQVDARGAGARVAHALEDAVIGNVPPGIWCAGVLL